LLDRIEGVFSTLFWALFGHVEMSTFNTSDQAQITEVTGHLLFATYSLASVLVALNLLIAMLSNTYKKVDVSFILMHGLLGSIEIVDSLLVSLEIEVFFMICCALFQKPIVIAARSRK